MAGSEKGLFVQWSRSEHLAGDEVVQIEAFAGFSAGHGFPLAQQLRRVGTLGVHHRERLTELASTRVQPVGIAGISFLQSLASSPAVRLSFRYRSRFEGSSFRLAIAAYISSLTLIPAADFSRLLPDELGELEMVICSN